MGAAEENELTDVVLCYQSMGISLDASPAVIEHMYLKLTEECKKDLASHDPALKEAARLNLEQIGEMYEKIRGSITYRAMEKEHQKLAETQAELKVKRPVHHAVQQKSLMMQCPRCNGSIKKGLKTCPVCKSPIYTAMEQVIRRYFTVKKVIVYCVILSVAALVAVRILNPDLFTGKKSDVDIFEPKDK